MTISHILTDTIPVPRDFYISDEAYEGLQEQAKEAGFCKQNLRKGLAAYIRYVLGCELIDARPDDIKCDDESLLQAGYAPTWQYYAPRRKRTIRLTDDDIVNACVQAAKLRISFPPTKRVTGAPTFFDFPQCTSALLEAIGTGWVTYHA